MAGNIFLRVILLADCTRSRTYNATGPIHEQMTLVSWLFWESETYQCSPIPESKTNDSYESVLSINSSKRRSDLTRSEILPCSFYLYYLFLYVSKMNWNRIKNIIESIVCELYRYPLLSTTLH